MYENITKEEQNLLLLESLIPAGERFYVWCWRADGTCAASSCPETDRAVLERAFRVFSGAEKAAAYGASRETLPVLVGSPIGMQWAITCEPARDRELLFVMGPVFYSVPVKGQIREGLRPYRDTLEDDAWARELTERLGAMPVLPHAIFVRYVAMVHNALTGQQLDVSVLFSGQDAPGPAAAPNPRRRDRTKVYLAERAMLQMVRTGDLGYQEALNLSSELSAGVPVEGRDPLQRFRISIIVFTSLACRAAMEGGLSPEVAYPLGDAYIEAAVQSRDLGELNTLALSMFHDFVTRVHGLNADPDLSPAVRKCCDYIQLHVNRDIRAADLAALTGYTEYYLTEKFKRETGTPLFLYIRRAKIERAKLLLESTSLSVREIAESLAFTTPNYFTRCFRELTGSTPGQYRRQHTR